MPQCTPVATKTPGHANEDSGITFLCAKRLFALLYDKHYIDRHWANSIGLGLSASAKFASCGTIISALATFLL